METAFIIAGVVAVIALGIVAIAFGIKQEFKALALVNEWAGQNSYRLLDWKYAFRLGFGVLSRRNFCVLPPRVRFWWTSSNAQTIYSVTVEDSTGSVRRFWVRCGGFFLGMLVKRIDVICEE
jgi:hypothetical protein